MHENSESISGPGSQTPADPMPVSFVSADQRTQYGDYAGTNG
jgi:hypothetical protein